MPHSDFLAWLSSATLKNFISGVSTRILMLQNVNLVYSLNRLRRRPQIQDDLKNDDDLKNEDNLKTKDDFKNENDVKNEDDLKMKTTSKITPPSKLFCVCFRGHLHFWYCLHF